MNQITTNSVTKGQLQALLETTSTDAVRFNLNSVCLDADRKVAVSTDGHMMMVLSVDMEGSGQAIIPRDLIQQAIRAMTASALATFDVRDGKVTVHIGGNQLTGSLIDGQYVDYIRVIPRETSGELAQFNGEYVGRLQRAFKRMGGNGSIEIGHNGKSAALVGHYSVSEAFAVLMPFTSRGVDFDARLAILGDETQAQAA